MYYNMLIKYIQSSGEGKRDIQKQVIDLSAENWISWHKVLLMTKCLLGIINLSHDASRWVLPYIYILFMTPSVPAAESKLWLFLILFMNKLIKKGGLEIK